MPAPHPHVKHLIAGALVCLAAAAGIGVAPDAFRSARAAIAARCALPPPARRTTEGRPRHALLSILGVLRRPGTAADSLRQHWSPSQQVFLHYVRRARTLAATGYYVVPVLFTTCNAGPADPASEGVILDEVSRRGRPSEAGGPAGELRTHGFLLTTGGAGGTSVADLVPDGVRAVALTQPADPKTGTHGFSIKATVVANVVVFPRDAPSTWSRTIWYGAGGKIIKALEGQPPVVAIGRSLHGNQGVPSAPGPVAAAREREPRQDRAIAVA
jgi:hypothetical protein